MFVDLGSNAFRCRTVVSFAYPRIFLAYVPSLRQMTRKSLKVYPRLDFDTSFNPVRKKEKAPKKTQELAIHTTAAMQRAGQHTVPLRMVRDILANHSSASTTASTTHITANHGASTTHITANHGAASTTHITANHGAASPTDITANHSSAHGAASITHITANHSSALRRLQRLQLEGSNDIDCGPNGDIELPIGARVALGGPWPKQSTVPCSETMRSTPLARLSGGFSQV